MARVVLIEAAPWDAAGNAVNVYLAGGGSRGYNHRGRTSWKGGVVREPKFTSAIGFDQSGWTGGALPQVGRLTFFPALPSTLTEIASRQWMSAPIEILVGDDSVAAPAWTTLLKGNIASLKIVGGAVEFVVADAGGKKLADPFLKDRFLGTGGIEGDVEVESRIKRRTFGKVFNVEGRVLRKAYNVFEFSDPTKPLQGFPVVRDKGRAGIAGAPIAWAGSIAATLAALEASTPPQGGYIAAPSIACVKWWTVPSGPLTADIQGEVGALYIHAAASLAARIAGEYGIAVNPVSASVLATKGASAEAGLHVAEEGDSAANVLDRLLLPCGLVWVLDPAGVMSILDISLANPVETLSIVGEVERVEAFRPVRSRKVGYQRSYRKHDDGEISAAVLVADVEGLGDLATLDTVKLGHAGPMRREDGTTPLTDAGVVTSLGQAASIYQQGAFATVNSAAYGSSLLTGFGTLAARATVRFGNEVVRADGTTVATDLMVVTSLGQANSILNQGTLATLNQAAWDANVSGRPLERMFDNLLDLSGWKPGGSVTTGQFVDPAEGGAQSALVTIANGPSGLPETVWRATCIAGGSAFDGGWSDAVVDANDGFDHAKTYLYSVFVMRPAGSTGFAYFGPRSLGSAVVQTLAGVDETNPYFMPGAYPDGGTNASVVADKWYLWIGLVHGSGYAGADLGVAGVYDPATGAKLADATEFKNKAGATTGAHRVFQYPGAPGGNTMYFARPRVREITLGDVNLFQELADVRRTSRIGVDGRISDPRAYNTQAILGPNSLTNLAPSYTVGGSNVTVNLPAHTRRITGPTGPVTLSYGAASGVVAFSAYWLAYIDDPNLTGFASPAVSFTSNPDDLLYPGRYHIASGIAPAAGGTGGTVGGGGGGGGYGDSCVAAYALVETLHRGWIEARHVAAGDLVRVLAADDLSTEWEPVEGNDLAPSPAVRLRGRESGVELDVSISTPLTLRGGRLAYPMDAAVQELPVWTGERVAWEEVEIVGIGETAVAHIRCNRRTYLAGNVAGVGIMTHNPLQQEKL